MSQSPIRLKAAEALPLLDPKQLFQILYRPSSTCTGKFDGDEGHANFVVSGRGPEVMFRGAKYELRMIHLHNASEHIVEHDDPDDMELHLVHAPRGNTVASPLVVVAILFKVCKAELEAALNHEAWARLIGSAKTKRSVKIKPLNFFPLLPNGAADTANWFHYEGSLTGYPFSEIVSWIVMRSPGDITVEEISALAHQAAHESRGLQPLDRRIVVRSFADRRRSKS